METDIDSQRIRRPLLSIINVIGNTAALLDVLLWWICQPLLSNRSEYQYLFHLLDSTLISVLALEILLKIVLTRENSNSIKNSKNKNAKHTNSNSNTTDNSNNNNNNEYWNSKWNRMYTLIIGCALLNKLIRWFLPSYISVFFPDNSHYYNVAMYVLQQPLILELVGMIGSLR